MNQYKYPNDADQFDSNTLPRPLDASVQAAQAQTNFPPLGTTLSSYAPQRPGTATQEPSSQVQKTSKSPAKKWLKRIIITLCIVLLLAGGYLGAKVLINASKSFGGNLFGLLQNEKLKGEDVGRVNILLAGNSVDNPGHRGAELTDSMMVISMDTVNNTAFMVSIPRDLYVDVPGNGYAKINEVYQDGNIDKFNEPGYPAGGMGLLEKVVERSFGIDINYYALVNYGAFRDAVNAVGGIDVTIDSVDERGLYDAMISRADGGPLRLSNGPQTLDGQTALNLARARGSGYSYGFPLSDFNRSENQRMMLVALKDKASSAGVLSNPLKLGSLLDSFGNNVETDFQTDEVRRLVELSQKIPSANIKSISLNNVDGKNYLTSYRTRSGQSALVPAKGLDNFTEISAFLEQLMAPPPDPAATPASSSE